MKIKEGNMQRTSDGKLWVYVDGNWILLEKDTNFDIYTELNKLGEGFLLLEERISKLERPGFPIERLNRQAECLEHIFPRLDKLEERTEKLEQKQESSELEKFGFKGEIAAMDETILDMQNEITELQQKQEVNRKAIADLKDKFGNAPKTTKHEN